MARHLVFKSSPVILRVRATELEWSLKSKSNHNTGLLQSSPGSGTRPPADSSRTVIIIIIILMIPMVHYRPTPLASYLFLPLPPEHFTASRPLLCSPFGEKFPCSVLCRRASHFSDLSSVWLHQEAFPDHPFELAHPTHLLTITLFSSLQAPTSACQHLKVRVEGSPGISASEAIQAGGAAKIKQARGPHPLQVSPWYHLNHLLSHSADYTSMTYLNTCLLTELRAP